MRIETKFIIDYFRRYRAMVAGINVVPEIRKIEYMKHLIDLRKDMELSPVQYDLFYAAMSNIEWDIVIKELSE